MLLSYEHDRLAPRSSSSSDRARRLLDNLRDRQPGRKVWFQYFDSHITFTNSYLPRLKYVHHNPVHHGLAARAENYPWCAAAWVALIARPAFRTTVEGFQTDTLAVMDAFIPQTPLSSD